MLGQCRVHFVLHLKHNGDIFYAIGLITENKIPLSSVCYLIVFFKISIRHNRTQQLIEKRRTMYFQSLSHHLCTHAGFKILIIVNLLLLSLKLQ